MEGSLFQVEELRQFPLMSCLPEAQLQRLARHAADLHLNEGEWLIREGEEAWFYQLISGSMDVLKILGGREMVVKSYKGGDFFGEVPLLLGSSAIASLRAKEPSRVMKIDRVMFKELLDSSKDCRALVMETMTNRLNFIQDRMVDYPVSRVLVVGSQYDTDCRDIRAFLASNRIPYEWVDRDLDPHRLPPSLPEDKGCPAVAIDGKLFDHTPTLREVAEALQLQTKPDRDRYDVVIVGAGPAGMAAGVYGASEGLKVLMVERSAAGGQAGTSSRIENYLGFPEGISGEDLTGRAVKQAVRFGAEIAMTRCIGKLAPADGGYELQLDGGDQIFARAVLLATGVEWRRLKAEGCERLLGRGVLYGASRPEARSVNGKKVFIVGGGNSAGQAAMFFSNYAAEVKVVVRGEGLRLSMSQYLIGEIASKANIEVVPFSEVVEARGDEHLQRLVVKVG